MSANQILVVDDEVGIRELLFEILRDEGYGVRLAENAQTARAARKEMRPDLVLLDIWMPDTDGITLLKEWAGSGLLTMPVVMMSGHGTIDSAVEATRIGAFDFLEKPISLPKLLATVGKALAGGKVLPQAGALAGEPRARARIVQELRQRLEQVSRLRTPVLLVGEPGCGFELLRAAPAPAQHAVGGAGGRPSGSRPIRSSPSPRRATARSSCRRLGTLGKAEQKGLAAARRQAREIQRAPGLRGDRPACPRWPRTAASTPRSTTSWRASRSACPSHVRARRGHPGHRHDAAHAAHRRQRSARCARSPSARST